MTISSFFVAMAAVQVPLLTTLGLMTGETALLGALALIPLLLGMPVGAWLAQKMSAKSFDIITLWVLGCLAAKLLYDAATSF